MRSGSEVLTQVNIPVTDGWQNWVTVTAVANLMAGPQILRIHSLTSGWNIAWWQAEYTEFYDPTNISLYTENEWIIYPNPVRCDGFFVHNTSYNQYNFTEIKVVNSLGEEVLAFRSENNPVWIERSSIRGSGIFFIEIRSGARRTVKRISLL